MCIIVYNMSIYIKNSTNNVQYEFKVLYALGIIFIVMGHCNGGGFSVFNEFLPFYSFHLALFIFSSGYFYNQQNELHVKNFILNKTKKLIVPLYLWNIFYGLTIHILKCFNFYPYIHVNINTLFIKPITNGHQFILNLGGWFVIPLFMVHVINIFVRKICIKFDIKINEGLFFVICLLFGFLGVFLSNHGYNNNWWLFWNRILYFLPFYSLGILYKKYKKYDTLNNLIYFGILIFILLVVIYYYGAVPSFIPSWADFKTYNVFIPFLTGIIGIAFWLRISKILCPALGKSKLINLLADSTYFIMINHMAGFMLLNTIFAFLRNYIHICNGFNTQAYKTMAWYYYLPHGKKQFLIIYVFFGIVFSLALKNIIEKISISLQKRNVKI